VGARTDAARAEVLAAREGLGTELDRLEAAGRAAVDIPARLRREPAKIAGSAAGAAFLLLGGPGRVVRGIRKAIFGKDANVPKSMLPGEVEKTLKGLGPDGEKIRGTLEREFAQFLEEKAPERRERDLGAAAGGLLANVLRPLTIRAGRQLAEQLLNPDGATLGEALRRTMGGRAATAKADDPSRSGSKRDGSGSPG
jgi:hypothetical protein